MSDIKGQQVLQIEPPREIVFKGPFTDVVNSELRLRNPTDQHVCFKVKTTAPKQYCVRPNSGVIAPGGEKTITVMLQPMDAIPVDSSKHKFMVQTCYTSGPDVDLDNIWKSSQATDLMYSKLIVVFDNRGGAAAAPRVESPATVQFSSPSASTIASPAAATNVGSVDSSSAVECLRVANEGRKRLEAEKNDLKREMDEMFRKNAKLQQELQNGLSEVGVPTLQVILLAIAGLLIGLIVGKLF